jgi:hypothetical protein
MSSMDFGRHDALLSCIEAILVIVPSDVVKCSTSDLLIAEKKRSAPCENRTHDLRISTLRVVILL